MDEPHGHGQPPPPWDDTDHATSDEEGEQTSTGGSYSSQPTNGQTNSYGRYSEAPANGTGGTAAVERRAPAPPASTTQVRGWRKSPMGQETTSYGH